MPSDMSAFNILSDSKVLASLFVSLTTVTMTTTRWLFALQGRYFKHKLRCRSNKMLDSCPWSEPCSLHRTCPALKAPVMWREMNTSTSAGYRTFWMAVPLNGKTNKMGWQYEYVDVWSCNRSPHHRHGLVKSNESHTSVRVWSSFGSEVLPRVPGARSGPQTGKADRLHTPMLTRLQTGRTCSLFAFQVLIRVHACGVNPVETYIRSGAYARKPSLPYTPGSDVAGVVEAVGDGVRFLKVSLLPFF